MVSLEKFNMQQHRYIRNIHWVSGINCGYEVSGCIGRRFYMMYPLRRVVKLYNEEAKSIDRQIAAVSRYYTLLRR